MPRFYLEVFSNGDAVTPVVGVECADLGDARQHAVAAAAAIEVAAIATGASCKLRLLDADRRILDEFALCALAATDT